MAEELYLSEKDFSLLGEVIASFHTIRDMDEMLMAIFQNIKSIFDIRNTINNGGSNSIYLPT
jgi:hypothetical protein